MAIKFTDRYQSYNYSEHSLTFDTSETVSGSNINSVTGWSILTDGLGSHGGPTRETYRGGVNFHIAGEAFGTGALKIYTDSSINQGNNWITFSFASSAVSGWRSSSRSNTASGTWYLYIMDDISTLTSGQTVDLPTNYQLLASGTGTASQYKNGVYAVCGQISINIETSQLTIYSSGTNSSAEYDDSGASGASASSSLIADGSTVSTSGWSGDLYLYMFGTQQDGSNYPTNQTQPEGFISPIILSNKPIGGQGTV